MKRSPRPHLQSHEDRRGTATVEFALVAPLFLTLVLGLTEMSRALEVSQNMSAAVREGARLAATDDRTVLSGGVTMNSKVIADIKNMLTASGIDGRHVTITITHADGNRAGQTFDLLDRSNYLQNFKITATVQYSQVGRISARIMKNQTMTTSVVLRLGRSTLTA